jgi:hypothetical protein
MRVAAPPLRVVGLEAIVGETLLDRFVTQLSSSGEVKVTTSRDIEQAIGLDRQRQLLGCGDGSATCVAELAGALGTAAVLSGNVVKVGSSYTVTLRFISGADGRELAAATTRVKDLDAVQDWLDAQAPLFVRKLVGEKAAPVPGVTTSDASSKRSVLPWVAVGTSAVALGAGVAFFIIGKNEFAKLKTATDDARITVLSGAIVRDQQLGVGLMIGGGVALAGSLVWALARPAGAVTPVVAVSGGGATVGLQGRLP